MRRVAITGIGIVSPCGLSALETWGAIVEGRTGIRAITRFDAANFSSRIAGECAQFNPLDWMDRGRVREGDTFAHYAIAASQMAITDAELAPAAVQDDRVGIYIGVSLGGLGAIEQSSRVLSERGPRKISPYFVPSTIANIAAAHISLKHGLRGPSFAISSACASGAHAIGQAARAIQCGDVDAAVAGGTEASITPLGVAGFCAMRALSIRNHEPALASRPFDLERDGFVIAEGAGLLVLEEFGAAKARGARIYAELSGYGASSDAHHLTRPDPNGGGAVRSMAAALRDAEVDPADVDYVNAHGTSTQFGDASELRAIAMLFGAHARSGLLVSSTKALTGHMLGAAGGVEAGICALALHHGIAPPTANLTSPCDEAMGMDLVPHTRRAALDVVMSNSFAFGGANVSLVLRRVQ